MINFENNSSFLKSLY